LTSTCLLHGSISLLVLNLSKKRKVFWMGPAKTQSYYCWSQWKGIFTAANSGQ
jgi:hypothetical protein